jgi:hypothetical protein
MAELGETTDPQQLIAGNTTEIRKSSVHLLRFGNAMLDIADGLKSLDTEHWTGGAADAFRERFTPQPSRWRTAAEAFHAAEAALERYCETLSWAQDQAAQAIELWAQGQQATHHARAEHQHVASQATAAGQSAPPFNDPGHELRQQAQEMLGRARSRVDDAGWHAAGALTRAQEDAPRELLRLDTLTLPTPSPEESANLNYVIIDSDRCPETASHIRDAQHGTSWVGDKTFDRTQPTDLTIDRDGGRERRAESMKQVPQTRPRMDRDEYPPAMFEEGGTGSSVKYISASDNRRAGRSIQEQTKHLDNGEEVIVVVD